MGHGPARELSDSGPLKELDPALSAKLDLAVKRLDALDPNWAQAREDERLGQLAKMWGKVCAEIDGHLRALGNVIINSHQIGLDMGSDGGGRSTTPWMEESSGKFPRLEFYLRDDGIIEGRCEGQAVGTGAIADVSYEWVENMVVTWIMFCVDRAR